MEPRIPAPAEPHEEVDWLEAEASAQTLRRELQRLKRRAKKKPFLLILLTLLGVAAVLHKISKRMPLYRASIIMRVTEGQVADESSPLSNGSLAHYLYAVALNRSRLLPIIEKHDLYPERATFGELHAVEKLRDALDIEISTNYFNQSYQHDVAERSVGISLHFTDFDPNLALEVAQDLGSTLIQAERDRRSAVAEAKRKIARRAVRMAEEKMSTLHEELADATVDLSKAKSAPKKYASLAATAELARRRLVKEIKNTQFVVDQVGAELNKLSLAQAAEGAQEVIRFEILDVRRPIVQPRTSPVAYAILGIFVFIVLLPICAIGVAAIDSRLHHMEDLMRLGMPVVGHMPSFPSDRMGSLRERGRRAKDVA